MRSKRLASWRLYVWTAALLCAVWVGCGVRDICLAPKPQAGRATLPPIEPVGRDWQLPSWAVVKTTAYCNCQKCCGWRRTWFGWGYPVFASGRLAGRPKAVGVTAAGTIAQHGTAAVDRKVFPFGTVFYIEGYGYARAEDVGGAIGGKHLDLWFPSHEEALKWGVKMRLVKIWRRRQGLK